MTEVPVGLRRRWWLAALVATAGAGVVAVAATRAFTASVAATWLAAAAVPLAYTLWFLRRSLASNYPSGDDAVTDGGSRVYPTLGVANGLTLTRGWLYAGVAGFALAVPPLESQWRWLPGLWYGSGVLLDWADGTVARALSRRTVLGERLDMAFDTLGFVVAPVVGVVWSQLPVWYLSVSAARYLYRFGCWTRRARGYYVGDLPESRIRRPLAAAQMVFISVALLPASDPSLVRPLALLAMLPTLAVFLRDYLAVTGRFGDTNANASRGPR